MDEWRSIASELGDACEVLLILCREHKIEGGCIFKQAQDAMRRLQAMEALSVHHHAQEQMVGGKRG